MTGFKLRKSRRTCDPASGRKKDPADGAPNDKRLKSLEHVLLEQMRENAVSIIESLSSSRGS
jgi:hypothetical protein